MAMSVAPRFQHQTYLIRKKFFKIFGAAFHVYGPDGGVVFYSKQKAFRLKEDIRLYGDESQAEEVLTIHARSWLDFAAAYDRHMLSRGSGKGRISYAIQHARCAAAALGASRTGPSRSERTRWHATVLKSTAEQIEQDLASVLAP